MTTSTTLASPAAIARAAVPSEETVRELTDAEVTFVGGTTASAAS